MTLQIGLVGEDGIVLASDRLVTTIEGSSYRLGRGSKFYQSSEMVCCWSGDEPAMYAASLIRDATKIEVGDRESTLRSCGNKAWTMVFGSSSRPTAQVSVRRKVLVAFPGCELWELEVCGYSIATKIQDKIVAGDVRTTINHLVNNYVPDPRGNVASLIPIAAHSILMSGRENPVGVGGLEIAVVLKAGPSFFLTSQQEEELAKLSTSIHNDIRALLLAPFDYRPVAPLSS